MKTIRGNLRPWLLGTLLALAGVVLARVIAGSCDGTARIVVTVCGQMVALGGLFVICLGVRRRIRQATGP